MFDKRKKSSAHINKKDNKGGPSKLDSRADYIDAPDDYLMQDDYIPEEEYDTQYYGEIPEEEYGEPYQDYDEDFYPEEEIQEEAPVDNSKASRKKKEKKSGAKKEKPLKEKKSKKEKSKKEKPEKEKKKSGKAETEEAADGPQEEEQGKKKGSHKKLKIILICVFSALILAFGGITYWAYTITHGAEIFPKIYLDGVFVGEMTVEQAGEALDKVDWVKNSKKPFTLKLPAGISAKLDICKAGAMYTKEDAVNAAYSYGHGHNIYDNLFKYIMNVFKSVDVSREFLDLDMDYISSSVKAAVEKFQQQTADESREVDDENDVLRMRKGAGQMELSVDKISQQVANALNDDVFELPYDTLEKELKMPDFEAIFDELNAEPKNAAFVGDRFEVEDEVIGCTFDVEQAKEIWEKARPADMIEIPLVITHPEITGDYLRSLLYRDVLGSQITYFKNSSDNRKNNIRLAAEAVDGVILMPGEVFSYNDTVGERTKEKGYLEAPAYDNGGIVQEVGGGICQVSSTLYCASMFSQMDTVERTNHYFKVSYLDWGLDATVSWGTLDFKFRNSREYPVKIRCYFDGEEESLQVDIIGTDVDGSYVKFSRSRLIIPHDLYPEVTIGYTVIGYRSVYDAEGNFIKKIEEPIGLYYLHEDEIKLPENTGVEAGGQAIPTA